MSPLQVPRQTGDGKSSSVASRAITASNSLTLPDLIAVTVRQKA
jgi:hypothetical protein